jgi:hypothetical protein
MLGTFKKNSSMSEEATARTAGRQPTLGSQSPRVKIRWKRRRKKGKFSVGMDFFDCGIDEFSRFSSIGALEYFELDGMDGESEQVPVSDGPVAANLFGMDFGMDLGMDGESKQVPVSDGPVAANLGEGVQKWIRNGSSVYETGKGLLTIHSGERISEVTRSDVPSYSFFGRSSCSSSGPSAVLDGSDASSEFEILRLFRDPADNSEMFPFVLTELRGFQSAIKLNQCRRHLRELRGIQSAIKSNQCCGMESRLFRELTANSGEDFGIEGNFAKGEVIAEWIPDFIAHVPRVGSPSMEESVPGVGSPPKEEWMEEKKRLRESGLGMDQFSIKCRVSGSPSSCCSPGSHSGTQSIQGHAGRGPRGDGFPYLRRSGGGTATFTCEWKSEEGTTCIDFREHPSVNNATSGPLLGSNQATREGGEGPCQRQGSPAEIWGGGCSLFRTGNDLNDVLSFDYLGAEIEMEGNRVGTLRWTNSDRTVEGKWLPRNAPGTDEGSLLNLPTPGRGP